VLDTYYRLNSAVRPELLQPAQTGFSAVAYGDEAQQRLDALARLVQQTNALYDQTEPRLKDAFYELVAYPVRAASLMNVKTLQAERSRLYAAQGRASANRYAAEAEAAFAQIKQETDFYNTQVAGGKWNHILSYQPRDRAAYQMPPVGHVVPGAGAGLGLAVEGSATQATLPPFMVGTTERHFFDVFDTGSPPLAWQATASAPWIQLSQTSGTTADDGRVWVSVDWAHAPAGATLAGTVTVRGAGGSRIIDINAERPAGLAGFQGFIEENGAVAIEAAHFSRARPGAAAAWRVVPDLGRQGDAVTPLPATAPSLDTTAAALRQAPRLEYDLQIFTPGAVAITAFCRPTHTIHAGRGLRYAIALNDEKPRVVDLESEEYSKVWAGNILRTAALGQSAHRVTAPGRQVLKIWMVDPGVVIDKLVLSTRPLPPSFLGPPETAYPAAALK